MKWRAWQVRRIGSIVTWTVDGLKIATIDTTMDPAWAYSGSDIFFGQFDINATSSADTNARALLFGLVDNVLVTDVVPEPTALSLVGLLGLTAVSRRRRAPRLSRRRQVNLTRT
jgi:hypothetical protein